MLLQSVLTQVGQMPSVAKWYSFEDTSVCEASLTAVIGVEEYLCE